MAGNELIITQSNDRNDEFRAFINQAIKQFNRNVMPEAYFKDGVPVEALNIPVDLAVKDSDGKLKGGLVGNIYWECLYVKDLWLDESLRKQGVGTHLLQQAEAIAHKNDCNFIWVQTFSWQARGFYEKNGFRIVGQLDNYPPRHTRYTLRKDLKANSAEAKD